MAPRLPALAALLLRCSLGTVTSPAVGLTSSPSQRLLQGAADATDLCGDSCEASATRGNSNLEERIRRRRNCRATWNQGCQNAPPRGFTGSSTLWEMCPHSCPSTINPRTAPTPPPTMLRPPPPPAGDPPPPPAPVPSPPAASAPAPEVIATPARPPPPPPPPLPLPPPSPQQQQQELPQQRPTPRHGPDKQVLRAEIRTRMLGAALDFLYGMCVATVGIICAVFYCRRRKRTMKKMGMRSRSTSSPRADSASGGPRPVSSQAIWRCL